MRVGILYHQKSPVCLCAGADLHECLITAKKDGIFVLRIECTIIINVVIYFLCPVFLHRVKRIALGQIQIDGIRYRMDSKL